MTHTYSDIKWTDTHMYKQANENYKNAQFYIEKY